MQVFFSLYLVTYHCLQSRASHLEKYDNILDENEAKTVYEKQAELEVIFQDDETDYLYSPPPKTGTVILK
jgi:hypothetical protein